MHLILKKLGVFIKLKVLFILNLKLRVIKVYNDRKIVAVTYFTILYRIRDGREKILNNKIISILFILRRGLKETR